MSITTYTELQTAVANWVARDDLTTYITDFISLAESRINRECRIRPMETALSDAISGGTVAVPSDYIEMKYAYINTTPLQRLIRKPADYIYENYTTRTAEDIPRYYAREAETFIFGAFPDSTYTMKGIYYAKIAVLSDAAPTNWFMTNASDLLLAGALAEAHGFMGNDNRLIGWESKFQRILGRVMQEDTQEDLSGSPLAMASQ